jgi:hypothetical protein
MKTTLTTSEAADILFNDKNANWSYAGARALAEYLEGHEESMGYELEFDYVAIRCDFSEWDSLQAWAADYFSGDWREEVDATDCEDEETDDKIREYIQDHGQLIEFEGGIIVSSF